MEHLNNNWIEVTKEKEHIYGSNSRVFEKEGKFIMFRNDTTQEEIDAQLV